MTRICHSYPRPAARLLAGLSGLLLICLLSSCSGGGGANSSTDSAANRVSGAAEHRASGGAAPGSAESLRSADSSAGVSPQGRYSAHPTDLTPRALVKTAAVSLQAADVGRVLQQISDAAVVANGEIASEQTSTNRRGQPVQSRLVLRIPVDNFDSTVAKISSLGRLKSLARSVDDVTTDVADIDSRVQSAKDSIAQLRRLFGAAQRLGQIIELENELSQREADLEALQAQQRVLADQTAMSTLTVTVSQPPHVAAPPPTSSHSGGFLAGLKSGWHALGVFLGATSRIVGVLLPFAVIGLLAFLAAWFVVRRIRPQARPRPSE